MRFVEIELPNNQVLMVWPNSVSYIRKFAEDQCHLVFAHGFQQHLKQPAEGVRALLEAGANGAEEAAEMVRQLREATGNNEADQPDNEPGAGADDNPLAAEQASAAPAAPSPRPRPAKTPTPAPVIE